MTGQEIRAFLRGFYRGMAIAWGERPRPRALFRRPRRYDCDQCGAPAGTSFLDPGFCSAECRDRYAEAVKAWDETVRRGRMGA